MKVIKFFTAILAAAVMFTACEKENATQNGGNGSNDDNSTVVEEEEMPDVEAVDGKVVVVLNAVDSAFVCGDIYLTGSFANWDAANAVKFVPVDGLKTWFKAEYTPDADPSACKAAHAKADGTFTYDYEWTADLEVIDGDAEAVDNGFGNINNLSVKGTGVVYVKVDKWAADPCSEQEEEEPVEPGEAKDITVKAKAPATWTNTITAWVWTTGGDGKEVTPTKEGDWYVVTENCAELNIIFKNGEGWNGNANQTEDIKGLTEDSCYELAQEGEAKATATAVDCE